MKPKRSIAETLVAAVMQLGEWPESVVRDCVSQTMAGGHGHDPAHLLRCVAWQLPPPPRQRFRVLDGGARFPRVWCPELSVLDAEVSGARVVWHVPARPGNDVELTYAPRRGAHEMPAKARRDAVARVEKPSVPPRDAVTRGQAPGINCRDAVARQSTLTAWLREQDGGRP